MRTSLLLVVLFVGACAKREEAQQTPAPIATAPQPQVNNLPKNGSMPVYKVKTSPMMPPRPPKEVAPDPIAAPGAPAAPAASASSSK
ncbi:MAG: hypothetical protein ACXVEE_01950 [Polyangiales bacterium]